MSKLIAKMLEEEMRRTEEYWRAYESWKTIGPWDIDAANRLSREEAHERRR
jgi:hypothetical protein